MVRLHDNCAGIEPTPTDNNNFVSKYMQIPAATKNLLTVKETLNSWVVPRLKPITVIICATAYHSQIQAYKHHFNDYYYLVTFRSLAFNDYCRPPISLSMMSYSHSEETDQLT